MKPEFKPRRAYEDNDGNTIDPRVTWDDLLKYYRKYRRLLGVGQFSRQSSSSTPTQALKLIIAEKIHRANKQKATELQEKDLKKKENKRKLNRRKR
ncbi:hypothetical protein KGY77_10200, partial [Candidatus Bipolaricaulota bacterium]|nr:hypothetical protein [Candidatus Bipolaricaulota bacterium]